MNARQIAEFVLNYAQAGETEVRVTELSFGLTRFANSFIHQNVAEEQTAISVRLAQGSSVAALSDTFRDEAGLRQLVDHALEIVRLTPPAPKYPGMPGPAQAPQVQKWIPATAACTPEQRAELAAQFIGADPQRRAAGYVSTQGTTVTHANSHGLWLHGRYTQAIIEGQFSGETGNGFVMQADLDVRRLTPRAIGEVAAQKAAASENPVVIEAGEYPVILEPLAVGTITTFVCQLSFNAQAVYDGRSFVELDRPALHPSIHLYDDALDPRAVGLPFDDEGVPKQQVDFVKDGIARHLAHNMRTAKLMGTVSNGQSRGQMFASGPIPANLFMAPGTTSLAEMIRTTDRGLLITRFNYNRTVNPKRTQVTGLTRGGTFLIENGRISKPVANLRYTQSYHEALQDVETVGDQAQFAGDYQPTTVHVPALKLRRFLFTGNARG